MKRTKTYTYRGLGYTLVILYLYFSMPSPLPREIATQIYCMYKEGISLEATQLHFELFLSIRY